MVAQRAKLPEAARNMLRGTGPYGYAYRHCVPGRVNVNALVWCLNVDPNRDTERKPGNQGALGG